MKHFEVSKVTVLALALCYFCLTGELTVMIFSSIFYHDPQGFKFLR